MAGALAYAWHDVTTDRYLSLAGTDHLTASFSAHNIAARIEGGYRFALPEFLGWWPGHGWFTPYGAVQAQAFFTPAYSESAISGSSGFALTRRCVANPCRHSESRRSDLSPPKWTRMVRIF
jgi:uncharacterized protein with beta-barrel porin domain